MRALFYNNFEIKCNTNKDAYTARIRWYAVLEFFVENFRNVGTPDKYCSDSFEIF